MWFYDFWTNYLWFFFQPCVTRCLIRPMFRNMKELFIAQPVTDANTVPRVLDLVSVPEPSIWTRENDMETKNPCRKNLSISKLIFCVVHIFIQYDLHFQEQTKCRSNFWIFLISPRYLWCANWWWFNIFPTYTYYRALLEDYLRYLAADILDYYLKKKKVIKLLVTDWFWNYIIGSYLWPTSA